MRCMYRGVLHKKMPLPVQLVVNGAPRFFTEPSVFLSMGQGEVVLLKESKLIDCESEDPEDVNGSDGMRGVVMLRDKGYVVVVI